MTAARQRRTVPHLAAASSGLASVQSVAEQLGDHTIIAFAGLSAYYVAIGTAETSSGETLTGFDRKLLSAIRG
jgi:hypothetical protein